MRVSPTEITGVCAIEPVPIEDVRGFFARSYCFDTLAEFGIQDNFIQNNISYNKAKGTFRGMHFQREPSKESKIVSCSQGAMQDIVLDLRPQSETYLRWFSLKLTSENLLSLYIPSGVAHGFQTLQDNTVVRYQMGDVYQPQLAAGVRWDQQEFGIQLPLPISSISEKDLLYKDYQV